MTESVTDDVDEILEEPIDQVERINAMIKKFAVLNETIDKSGKSLLYYDTQLSTLSASNWTKKMKYNELQKRQIHLRTLTSETVDNVDLKEQDWKKLKANRTKEWSAQCDKFQSQCMDYANNFPRAISEYSVQSLRNDIGEYHERMLKLKRELEVTNKKLQETEARCSLNYLRAGADVEEISKIIGLLSDIKVNNYTWLHEIKPSQDNLKQIQGKLKQCKTALNEYKKKM